MPLTRTEDFHAPAPSEPYRPVYAVVAERIRDASSPMPPWPYVPLDDAAIARLDAWVAQGAPADRGASGVDVEPPPPALLEPEPAEIVAGCDVVAELRAHRAPVVGDETPFVLEGAFDGLECFVFSVPWSGSVHALRIDPLVDDPTILHHASLGAIEEPTEYTVPGKVSPCRPDQDPVSYALAFWSPGTGATVMPDGVGYLLPDEQAHLLLQVHYTSRAGSHEDRTGFRICGTHALRSEEAQLHWLGSEAILVPAGGAASISSECPVRGDEPVYVLSVMPHMHLLGRRMTIERLAADGAVEILHDRPFAFVEQRIYPTDWVLAPGDRVRTTCHYENATEAEVGFGQRTDEEMCYAFTVAYPAGRLSNADLGMGHLGCLGR